MTTTNSRRHAWSRVVPLVAAALLVARTDARTASAPRSHPADGAQAADPRESSELGEPGRLLVGVGDRVVYHGGERPVRTAEDARRLGVPVDFLQLWLPDGWKESWSDARRRVTGEFV